MAVRVEDHDGRISNLAKLFFHELSKKGELWYSTTKIVEMTDIDFLVTIFFTLILAGSNPIYNLLPDILGKLFTQDLQKESFCNIMQFLIGSIKKVYIALLC